MFNIPESNLPDCLKDENRINVLFSPIRPRSVNPKDWESKISSWKSIIKIYCDSNDIYTFTVADLNKVFIRNGRPPSCLPEVILEMGKSGEIQPLDVFLTKNPRSWSGWASNLLIKKPILWSYNKLKQSVLSEDTSHKSLVHLEVIKLKCDNLLNSIPDENKNKLISFKDLLTLMKQDVSKIEDVKLLLHYLSNQNLIDITYLNNNNSKQNELDTTLIKFCNGQGDFIKELDIGIYSMEQNEKTIVKSIEQLEDSVQNCIKEAKMHLSKNHKQMAKTCLRKKRDMEKMLEKKANALHNIQTLLHQIHETNSNANVWDAYKNALSAFDTTFKNTGISEDVIDDTMIKLGEVLDKNQDIQSALSTPTQEVNDSDLEAELEDLLKEDVPRDDPPNDSGTDLSDLENKLNNMSINLPDLPDQSINLSGKDLEVMGS